MRRFARLTKVKAMGMVLLLLALDVPKSAAQEPGTATAAAWVICETPAGPVLVMGTCAAAAGACVGYGVYTGISWCWEWWWPTCVAKEFRRRCWPRLFRG